MPGMTTEIVQLSPYEIKANNLRERAESLVVSDAVGIGSANALFKECQETLADIRRIKDAILEPHEAMIEAVKGLAKNVSTPIDEAKTRINAKVATFKAEQERILREAEEAERKRQAEELRKQEEAARARLAAERELQEAEAARLAEIAKKQGEEAQRLEAERLALERQKREQEAEKAHLEAERIEEARRVAAEAELAKQEKEAERTKARGLTTFWKYRVVDIRLLDKMFMMPDPTRINEEIRSGTREIPGLEIYAESKMK